MYNKVIYAGIFFPAEETIKLIHNSSRILENQITNPHVTFQFGSESSFPKELIGKKVNIKVVGEGSTDDNQGFEIEVPNELKEYYKGAYIPHITMSVSKTGKPVNTKDIDFKKIKPFEVTGKIGYFTDRGTIFEV